jgi:hypothetical protein
VEDVVVVAVAVLLPIAAQLQPTQPEVRGQEVLPVLVGLVQVAAEEEVVLAVVLLVVVAPAPPVALALAPAGEEQELTRRVVVGAQAAPVAVPVAVAEIPDSHPQATTWLYLP